MLRLVVIMKLCACARNRRQVWQVKLIDCNRFWDNRDCNPSVPEASAQSIAIGWSFIVLIGKMMRIHAKENNDDIKIHDMYAHRKKEQGLFLNGKH